MLIQKQSEDMLEWANVKPFFKYRKLMTVKNNNFVVYKGRLFVPPSLRKAALEWVHFAHQGYNNMMLRVNKIMLWPNITRDV